MAFTANPLSLSVPDPAFETWLRENRFLEILDDRTTALAAASSPSSADDRRQALVATTRDRPAAIRIRRAAVGMSLLSLAATLASLLTVNPFSKLAAEDFAGETPSWTRSFLGPAGSFAWPASPSQVRMRVHENVKRYVRNYSILAALFLACALYQMPVALVGFILCLLLWEMFRICDCRWGLDKFPFARQTLLYAFQCATAVLLFFCNVQIALFWAICVGYAVMLFHASLRKLTPSKQPMRVDNHRKTMKNK